MNKGTKKIIVSLLLILSSVVYGQSEIVIRGKVTDENGKPLPYANVYISGTLNGAMTDDNGKFEFSWKPTGKAELIASMVGYKNFKKEIDQYTKKKIYLEIKLEPAVVKLSESIVTGSSFGSEAGKGIVVKSIDILTTPGGAADIYQSLKTMPGLTQVSESAQLYVRGGDPTETVTLIDQAPVYHPYTLESAYGGLFSNLNTASVRSMYFSSGGFSVKYGNVLSGILDVETKDIPEVQNFNLGVSMASADVNTEVPLFNDKLGFRLYAQQSYTKPIMWLNGSLNEFTATPTSRNINAALTYKYSQTGKLKLFGMLAADEQGVNVKRAEFTGVFNGNTKTKFVNLQQKDILFSNVIMKNSLSFSSFESIWKLGILDLTRRDEVFQFRSDLEKIISTNLKILAGTVFQKRTEKYTGKIPLRDYDLRDNAESKTLNEKIPVSRIGAYIEIDKLKLFGIKNLYGIFGLRTDYAVKPGINTIDPRLALGYKLNDKSNLKIGWGIFHQLPEGRLLAESDGNSDLKSMSAVHYVISYDYAFDNDNSLRAEVYYKSYKNLPLEDKEKNYTSNGYGFAKGLDLILKGKLPLGISGWISYGFINTQRKWKDFTELTVSEFDITYNLSVVAKYNFSSMWQIGINFKYATGKPFTPIISSVFIPDENLYKPVYGKTNSERYPDYKRLDFRITHLNRMFNKYFTVFYIEMLNILNFNNLFGYTYNYNYTEKERINSYFGRRTIVFGTSINF